MGLSRRLPFQTPERSSGSDPELPGSISTIRTLTCLDLESETILWEKSYEGGCDRRAISPDGRVIFLPSYEKEHWHAVDAISGDVIQKIVTRSGAHNTIYGPDGRHVYLAGLRSPLLYVADAGSLRAEQTVGPFSASIRPFTVNGSQTLCFVNVNDLLGFEMGDLKTGKFLHRVEVHGFEKAPRQASRLPEPWDWTHA